MMMDPAYIDRLAQAPTSEFKASKILKIQSALSSFEVF